MALPRLLAATITVLLLGASACDQSSDGSTAPAPKEGHHGRHDHAAESADAAGTQDKDDGKKKDGSHHDRKDHDTDGGKDDSKDRSRHDSKGDGSKDAASNASGSGSATAGGHGHDAKPDEIVFYVSMHGADGGNTLVGLTAKGEVKGSVLRGAPPGEAGDTLRDLRGMCLLGDGSLLVVNAWMQDTRILKFGAPGSDGIRNFERVFIKGGTMNPALLHTYSVVVGPDGSIYCSNQDSNTITRYAGPGAQAPGEPLPVPPSLASFGDLAPGTFVPSSKTSPEGLVAVRGIAFGPDGLLYVADRSGSRVSAYDPKSGERRSIVASEKDGLKRPIQLAFSPDGRFLYIGDNGENCVWRKDLDSGALTQFVAPKAGGLDAPSAVVVTDSHLYVGNRKGKAILRFRMPDGHLDPHALVEKLPDDPEFLLYLR